MIYLLSLTKLYRANIFVPEQSVITVHNTKESVQIDSGEIALSVNEVTIERASANHREA